MVDVIPNASESVRGTVQLASTAEVVTGTDTAKAATSAGVAAALAALGSGGFPGGHIFGLGMSNAADAAHDITVAAGEARNEANNAGIALVAAITKQIDAGWAVGNNAGGLNTGSVANATWYEVHLIRRSDTGVVDAMFTTTANRATLPTSYDSQRRIGWVRTDGSANILAFTQVDDWFTWTTQINDASVTNTATAAQIALTAPPNSVARFRASMQGAGSGATVNLVVFSEVAEGNITPLLTTGINSLFARTNLDTDVGHFELRVDASSQIEHDGTFTTSAGTFDISTFGWIDTRGRLS